MWSAAIYLQSMHISIYIMGLYLEVRHSLKRVENISLQRKKKADNGREPKKQPNCELRQYVLQPLAKQKKTMLSETVFLKALLKD